MHFGSRPSSLVDLASRYLDLDGFSPVRIARTFLYWVLTHFKSTKPHRKQRTHLGLELTTLQLSSHAHTHLATDTKCLFGQIELDVYAFAQHVPSWWRHTSLINVSLNHKLIHSDCASAAQYFHDYRLRPRRKHIIKSRMLISKTLHPCTIAGWRLALGRYHSCVNNEWYLVWLEPSLPTVVSFQPVRVSLAEWMTKAKAGICINCQNWCSSCLPPWHAKSVEGWEDGWRSMCYK